MKKYLFIAIILLFISCNKFHEDSDAIINKDFVLRASITNFTQADIGALAASRATNEALRSFAQTIVTYHNAIQIQLKSLASELFFPAPDSIDAQHRDLKYELLDLSGREFDSVYVHSAARDYQLAVNLFLEEMVTGQNEQLRNYSASVLPNLQIYLKKADSLATTY